MAKCSATLANKSVSISWLSQARPATQAAPVTASNTDEQKFNSPELSESAKLEAIMLSSLAESETVSTHGNGAVNTSLTHDTSQDQSFGNKSALNKSSNEDDSNDSITNLINSQLSKTNEENDDGNDKGLSASANEDIYESLFGQQQSVTENAETS
jgi:hypothetical protein